MPTKVKNVITWLHNHLMHLLSTFGERDSGVHKQCTNVFTSKKTQCTFDVIRENAKARPKVVHKITGVY